MIHTDLWDLWDLLAGLKFLLESALENVKMSARTDWTGFWNFNFYIRYTGQF